MSQSFTWKMGGPAGFGIMSTGPMFARILKKSGYFVQGYPEYPSLVRGGYNSYAITISGEPVYGPCRHIDLYVALSDVAFEKDTFTEDTILLADFSSLKKAEGCPAQRVDVPFAAIVDSMGGKEIMRNTVAVGASAALIGIPFASVEAGLASVYKGEGFTQNLQAARAGYDACAGRTLPAPEPADGVSDALVVSGNEVAAFGAIAAGMQFFAGYPMSPASNVLHVLAENERKYGYVVKHMEDEIGAMNAVVGAAFAGARSMTATAGGGFALMTEALGLAAMIEAPVVVYIAQRPGPATGMPTWTEQADLRFALHAAPDEFLRAVYTPGDVDELYAHTFDAFNVADRFQIPAIVLSDKFLAESTFTTLEPPETEEIDRGLIYAGDTENPYAQFQRYKEVENGVPMRSIPGTPGGIYIAASNEHDETGFVTDSAENRVQQQDRRFRKEAELAEHMPLPVLYGDPDAAKTFVCWGSTKQSLLEAMKCDSSFNVLHFPAVHPLRWDIVTEILSECGELILCETNMTGQLGGLIREKTGVNIERALLKYDGRPLFVEDIQEFLAGGEA